MRSTPLIKINCVYSDQRFSLSLGFGRARKGQKHPSNSYYASVLPNPSNEKVITFSDKFFSIRKANTLICRSRQISSDVHLHRLWQKIEKI